MSAVMVVALRHAHDDITIVILTFVMLMIPRLPTYPGNIRCLSHYYENSGKVPRGGLAIWVRGGKFASEEGS